MRYCLRVVEISSSERAPGLPKRAWHAWKRFGKRMADVQARILLTLFYFIVVPPFGLAVRWFADPLAIKPGHKAGWVARGTHTESALTRARRQF